MSSSSSSSHDSLSFNIPFLQDDEDERTNLLVRWSSVTIRLTELATIPFLFLQLPQIVLNTRNLIAGNYQALFAVQWKGQLTSLLGNLSLLSYFAKKRERGAMGVQTVGVITTLVVLFQLAVAGAMPSPALVATTVAVVIGLVLNSLNYAQLLHENLWRLWESCISVGGTTVLVQVMWSTFEPYIPPSLVPGAVTGVLTLALVSLEALSLLPDRLSAFTLGLSAWTATLLFMWTPVAQMWQNFVEPANVRGLSPLTLLLAMLGNGLLIPRALFTRDIMWFTGASWGTLLQGWGLLLTLWIANALSSLAFGGVTVLLVTWLGFVLFNDARAYDLKHCLLPLVELFSHQRSLIQH